MAARSGKTLTVGHPFDHVFDAAERVLAAAGARLTDGDRAAGLLTASRGDSFLSSGEMVTVLVRARPEGGCTVDLQSESADGRDLDWGRNATNVEHLERALRGALGVPDTPVLELSPAPPPPALPTPHTAARPGFLESVPVIAARPGPVSPMRAPAAPIDSVRDAAPAPGAPASLPAGPEPADLLPVRDALADAADAELGRTHALLGGLAARLETSDRAAEASAPEGEAPATAPRLARPSHRRAPDERPGRSYRGIGGQVPISYADEDDGFMCAIDGEPGPVEQCVRCGRRVCARHRRRSRRSGIFLQSVYVCESCFQAEVAEEGGRHLRRTTPPPLPSFGRTGEGWHMQVGEKAANLWAALGTALSALMLVVALSALTRSFGVFVFLLMVAAIGFYVWGAKVSWWSEEALQAAPAGRRRAVWLLAAPGLFLGGAALRLALLVCRAVGARDLAARLDRPGTEMVEAAEDALHQALNE